jgi:superfamily I DNA and/or RNA helicase
LLVGDHKQLPPTFSEEVKDAIQTRFGVGDASEYFASDFERIFNSEYGKKVGTTLLTQYRMAPTIGELVSSGFYDGKLQTERPESPEYYDLLPESLSRQVTWVDMTPLGERGFEQSSDDDKDKWNETEARVVMGVLKTIIDSDFMAFLEEDLPQQEPAIGIICMYDKQREFIDRMKAETVWLGDTRRLVKVDTVDSYQGKENRIVILTTVRNNRELRPGFLQSPNRINVAMSRAMERLIIIGSSRMWRGRNAQLPLGRVVAKIEALQSESKALMISADSFLER